jgi:hypothetical protein
VKRQYLGDSKDAFKWDYLSHLVHELGFPRLQVIPMLTANDPTGHGESEPEYFNQARPKILEFCRHLRECRSNEDALLEIRNLPAFTREQFAVDLYKPEVVFENSTRSRYFRDTDTGTTRLIFLDPDNGFEPAKKCSAKHVRYCEIELLLQKIPSESAVVVFQHFRRKSFPEEFANIRASLYGGHSTAVYWGKFLMLILVSRSQETILAARDINCHYSASRGLAELP